jgi:ribosomal protein L37AE/L43A
MSHTDSDFGFDYDTEIEKIREEQILAQKASSPNPPVHQFTNNTYMQVPPFNLHPSGQYFNTIQYPPPPPCNHCGTTTLDHTVSSVGQPDEPAYRCPQCGNIQFDDDDDDDDDDDFDEDDQFSKPTPKLEDFLTIPSKEDQLKLFAQNTSDLLKHNSLLIVPFRINVPRIYGSFHRENVNNLDNYVAIFPYGHEDQQAAIFQLLPEYYPDKNSHHNEADIPAFDPLAIFLTTLTLVGYEIYLHTLKTDGSVATGFKCQNTLYDPFNPEGRAAWTDLDDIPKVTGKPLPPQFKPALDFQQALIKVAQAQFKAIQDEADRKAEIAKEFNDLPPLPPANLPNTKTQWTINVQFSDDGSLQTSDAFSSQESTKIRCPVCASQNATRIDNIGTCPDCEAQFTFPTPLPITKSSRFSFFAQYIKSLTQKLLTLLKK